MRNLYPEINPYNEFRLKVSDLHELHVEEVGNPNGKPIVYLHGGPGAGITESYRRYHNPEKYRIILFDQRGAGRSTPFASLEENTTWDIVSDMEKIREHLGIEKWQVFGGSWGSTLGLAYSQTHPERVSELILRGIFLCRQEEIQWFYQFGAHHLFPDFWEEYISPIPENEREDLVQAFYKRLTGDDDKVMRECARAWSGWEGKTLNLISKEENAKEFGESEKAISLARIECHYFVNKIFMDDEIQLLKNAWKLREIPGVIVHGRYDVVTAMKNAWDLKKSWPEADLKIISDAGHGADEPGIIDALIEATDKFS